MDSSSHSKIIFDPIYGFIKLTKVEWDIIHSPFYQRLRWIRQLGFSSYIFHGAEHSRFGHSIGAMFNAHKITLSCGLGVSEEELFSDAKSEAKHFHQTLRLGALLHDLGTFPFSHTTEMAYIRFGETENKKDFRRDDHEHLGSFIIKKTDYPSGITYILKQHNISPEEISDLVKGISPKMIANQILHSEIDCDRMDYLLRDAYYTGLKYGSYDRDYLLHHFTSTKIDGRDILVIKHNATHCVEDFLNSRFAWYSQVVRSARGAKYDAIAERITFHFLEKNIMWRYSQLLDYIANEPLKFYSFSDHYFMQLVHQHYLDGSLSKYPAIREMAYDLLFENTPKTIRIPEFDQRLLNQDKEEYNKKVIKKAYDKVKEINAIIEREGSSSDWIIPDIPEKHIVFVKSVNTIIRGIQSTNPLLERDPVKILGEDGVVRLLAEVESSTISHLQNVFNFIPNVFCSQSAWKILEKNKIVSN